MPFAKRASAAKARNRALTFQSIAQETDHAISFITKILHTGRLPKRRPTVKALAEILGLDPQESWEEVCVDRLGTDGRALFASQIRYKRALPEALADVMLYLKSIGGSRGGGGPNKDATYTTDAISQILDMKMIQILGSEEIDRVQRLMGFFTIPEEARDETLRAWERGQDGSIQKTLKKGARPRRASNVR
jgi:hypothetical protein